MPIPATVFRLLLFAICTCAGCRLPTDGKRAADALMVDQPAAAASSTAAPNPSGPAVPATPPAPTGNTAGAASPVSTGAPDPHVLDDVLAELAALGPIQPEAQQRLIDDLRKTDPAYWPMLVQTFRASIAYRRRAAGRAVDAKTPPAQIVGDALPNDEIVQVAAMEPVGEPVAKPSVAAPAGEAAGRARSSDASLNAADAGPSTKTPQTPAAHAATNALVDHAVSQSPWQQHLAAVVGELERQTRERPNDPESLANQVYLRLLALVAGKRDEALRPIPGLPPAQQDYWSKQFFALSTYLDNRQISDPTRRAAEAGIYLSQAVASLREEAPLVVRNLTFCTEVHSYGVLKRFEAAEFKAAQKLLIYAEVENFKSEESAQGFHTSLEARYQILDSQGRRVAHDDLPLTEETCQNRRRDFFVRYFVDLPKTIYEGSYTLELTIEDKLGRKIGSSPIAFSIKQK